MWFNCTIIINFYYASEEQLFVWAAEPWCSIWGSVQRGRYRHTTMLQRLFPYNNVAKIISTFSVQVVMCANRIKNPGCRSSDEDQLAHHWINTHLITIRAMHKLFSINKDVVRQLYAIVRRPLTTSALSQLKLYLAFTRSIHKNCAFCRSASIESAKYLRFLWTALSTESIALFIEWRAF